MTVSRAFWKIVLKNIGTIITYSVMLIIFGSLTMGSPTTTQYSAEKPAIVVFNNDEEVGVTKGLMDYLRSHTENTDEYEDNDELKDALFYERVHLVVTIPKGYHADVADGKNPEIETRSSAGYAAQLAKSTLERYLTITQSYNKLGLSENELVERVNKSFDNEVEVGVNSKVDTTATSKAARYFSFANYSILACVITIICLVMSSFNRQAIRKRNIVSSVDYKTMNRVLLRNCCFYALGVWLLYVVMGVFLVGSADLMNWRGLFFVANSLLFSVCATSVAFLISNLVFERGAINGVMNVVAIGSSFLCGAYVPVQYMPESVLAFAHVLPSYYYINTNNRLIEIEECNFESILPVLINMLVIVGFSVAFIVAANIISKKRRKIA